VVEHTDDPDRLLAQLEEEEGLVSKQRSRLHKRIEYARTTGDGTGSPASAELLAALDTEERELSTRRRDLHVRIDQMRAERERR